MEVIRYDCSECKSKHINKCVAGSLVFPSVCDQREKRKKKRVCEDQVEDDDMQSFANILTE